jgi:signal transduction histidine kinase/ActR/RegA family two-component response regulator
VPWQITALLISSVFELVMLFLVRSRLRTLTAGPFCLALLFNALWAFGYAIELMVPTLEDKLLVFQIRCSFLCFYAPAWLEMVHRMTLGRSLIRGWVTPAVFLVPVVTLVLLWFPGPGQNPLLRHTFWLDTAGGLPVLRNTWGPWGVIYYLYNYAVWAVIFVLLYPRKKHPAWERRGRLIFLVAACVGWTADVCHLFELTTPAGLNYAPIVFPVTSVLVAFALFRHRLLNLAPVARAALIEQLEDRIMVFDDDGRVVDFNRAAATTLALPKTGVMGRQASDVLGAWPELVALFPGTTNARTEVKLAGADFEASLLAVLDGHDERTRARVLVLRDITRSKENETQLRVAKEAAEAAGQAQSRFLATMSHEIRTPLNGVVGFTQMLKDTPLGDTQRDYVELIEQSSRSLLVIINDVLDYSKIVADQLEIEQVRCQLDVIIDQAGRLLQPLAAKKGLTLAVRKAAEVPAVVISDPVRLQQILNNLLGNAVKFTESGHILLEVGSPGEGHIMFRITDTGIGIAPDQQERIFNPFSQADVSTTRRFGGTGLGLSITRRLCGLMGGSLTLQSQLGRGSIFTATVRAVPVFAPAEVPAAAESAPGARPASRRLRLLVFEDNPINQKVTGLFLARFGHESQFVENGVKGLAVLEHEKFDALLMDLEMPVMDGYETVRRIRAGEKPGGPRVYIIAVTAHALKGERERCMALGMDDFLTKPVILATLHDALARVPVRAKE